MTKTIWGGNLVLAAVLLAGCGSAGGEAGQGDEATSSVESAATTSLAFTPASHAFGTILDGTTAAATFDLKNSGKKASGKLTLSLSGAISEFNVHSTTCAPAGLAAGASCQVVVDFAPPAGSSGAATATLKASSTSAGSTKPVSLSGTAGLPLTLSGSVTGLLGAGLALSDGQETLHVAANGTFAFSKAFLSGSAYSVTVQTQPTSPWQVCTVANGAGTFGKSNVTNVAVSCVTEAFTVGGTVSGLTAPGLVLNDGHDTLSVAPGTGAFTFPTALGSGSAYSVVVTSQPVGELCTVTNGSGTVAGSAVTTVHVSCVPHTFPVTVAVHNGSCSGGFCNSQCGTIPLVVSGGVTTSLDGAGSSSSTPTTFSVGNAAGGSNVTVEYNAPANTFCTCSTDPNNIHAQCANWGCSMSESVVVTSATTLNLYCEFPIL